MAHLIEGELRIVMKLAAQNPTTANFPAILGLKSGISYFTKQQNKTQNGPKWPTFLVPLDLRNGLLKLSALIHFLKLESTKSKACGPK